MKTERQQQNERFARAITAATGTTGAKAREICLALTNDERLRLASGGLSKPGLVAQIASDVRERLRTVERPADYYGGGAGNPFESESDQQSAVSDQPAATDPTVVSDDSRSTVEQSGPPPSTVDTPPAATVTNDEARDDATNN